MQALCGLQGIFDLFNCKTPELVGNISEQTASGCQNAINHICCKLPVWFGEPAGDFIRKSQNFSFQTVSN